jgi:cytochrome P450
MAVLEAQLIVATVAQRFELRLVPGHHVVPERLFVLRPRGGLPMTIEHLATA